MSNQVVSTAIVETMPMLAEPTLAEPMLAEPIEEVTPAPVPITLLHSLGMSLKELRKGKYLLLPIRKISGINVEVMLRKEDRSCYILFISPTDFCMNDALYEAFYERPMYEEDFYKREGTPLSEDKFIDIVVRNALVALKSIKIDKLNGKFTISKPSAKEVKTDALWSAFCQEFKDDENIVLSMNECCVCFTVTKTTTNCEHAVCLECISKLRTEPVADDEHNSNKMICPMCRQRILFLN